MRRPILEKSTSTPALDSKQVRTLYIKQFQALNMLKEHGIVSVKETPPSDSDFSLAITVGRTELLTCLTFTPSRLSPTMTSQRKFFMYNPANLTLNENDPWIASVAQELHCDEPRVRQMTDLARALLKIFVEKEAFLLEIKASFVANGDLEIHGARFGFDDAAYRSSGRQEEVHRLRSKEEEVPEEVEAEKDGIVYIK